jgi:membrane-associated phospholipid phosphatase
MVKSLPRWHELSFLFAGYSIVAGSAWVLRSGLTTKSLLALAVHLVIAGLLVLTARKISPDHEPPKAKIVMLAPWALWLMAWSEIGWLYESATPEYFDQAVIQWDLMTFGRHLNELLPDLWSGGMLKELFTGFYISYYPLILGPPLILALQRRWSTLLNYTYAVMLTNLTCFAIYLVLPVLGPRDLTVTAEALASSGSTGYFSQLMNTMFSLGNSIGTAFPSSHCAGSATAAYLCYRHFSWRTGLVCGVWAFLVVLSTIQTNNHYAIDALAAIGLVALVQALEAYREKIVNHRSHRVHR